MVCRALPKLRDLSLYKNLLSGELPTSLSTMARLERYGIIPEEVCSLTNDYALTEFVMTCLVNNGKTGALWYSPGGSVLIDKRLCIDRVCYDV